MRKDPIFRAQFHTMCANIGVDPLASNKGAWTQLLGFGDFYYELGVQVGVNLCHFLHVKYVGFGGPEHASTKQPCHTPKNPQFHTEFWLFDVLMRRSISILDQSPVHHKCCRPCFKSKFSICSNNIGLDSRIIRSAGDRGVFGEPAPQRRPHAS